MSAAFTRAIICSALLAISGLKSPAQPVANALPLLTRVEQVRKLSPDEARKGFPVRFEGVVTYSDPDNPLVPFLTVQDGAVGVGVVPRSNQSFPKPGQRVIVEGTAEPGLHSPCVNRAVLEVLGPGAMPEPARRPLKDLLGSSEDARWIEVRGTIRSIVARKRRVEIEIISDQQRASVQVRQFSGEENALLRLLDAIVRIQGVCVLQVGIKNNPTGLQVLVSDLGEVAVEKASPQEPFSLPITPIASATNFANILDRRVRIQGEMVEKSADGALLIEDETGRIRVQTKLPAEARVRDRVDATGFPVTEGPVPSLEDGFIRVLAPALGTVTASATNRTQPARLAEHLPLLTTAREVRSLSAAEAGRGYPVRLRGVVTYFNPARPSLFVQDPTAGIYVDPSEQAFSLKHGQLVEVEGFSHPGRFAPMIVKSRIQALGEAPLPVPVAASLDLLPDGKFDSQWVETHGVIRARTNLAGEVVLDLVRAGTKTKVWLLGSDRDGALTNFVDAAIRLQGVSATHFDDRRRLVGFHLFVPGPEHLKLVRPPPRDPFDLPHHPIGELLRFTSQADSDHRIKVRGTVTLQRPGLSLFLSDPTGSLYIRTHQTNLVQPGDQVEVIGFPLMSDHAPLLEDSFFRRVGGGEPTAPVSVNAAREISPEHEFRLVRVEARLVDHTVRPEERVLVMQAGEVTFPAVLDAGRSSEALLDLREGSLLELTGVCFLEIDQYPGTQRFRLLLRSPGDVVTLQSAPWWTLRHAVWVMGSMGAGTLAVLGWVVMLRRRVHDQTEVIRRRYEHEAALEEQYRELFENASDMVYTHDLEGNFTSVNKAGERILGYSQNEFLASNGFQVLAPECREISRKMLEHKLAQGGQTAYELTYVAKDGRRVTMEVNTRLIDQEGKITGVHGIARDITERRKADFLSATLSNLGHRLSAARSPAQAAEIIVELAQEHFGWDACYLHLFAQDHSAIIPVVHFDTIDGQRVSVSHGYVDMKPSAMDLQIVREGKKLILRESPSIESTSALIAFGDRNRPSASLMFVPIRHGAEVVGVFSIQSYTLRAYDEEDLAMLQGLADHCGGALERIRAEQALRKSETHYRALIENSSDGISLVGANGAVLYASPSISRILGYSVEEDVGTNAFDRIHPEDLPRARQQFASLLRLPGRMVTARFRSRHKDGAWRWLEGTGMNLLDEPEVQAVVLNYRDVTERKRAEDALHASEEKYRSVVENSIQGIMIHQDSWIQFANEALARILGYESPALLIGCGLWDIISAPEDRPMLEARIAACLRGETVPLHHGWRTYRKDGSPIWIQSGASRILWKDRPAILAFLMDVTDRRRAEEALRQSEERFAKAFQATPVSIAISAVEGERIVDVNGGFLRLFGFSRAEVIGHSVFELGIWVEANDRAEIIRRLRAGQSVRDQECRLRTKSGEIRETFISAELMEWNNEPCVLVITHDLTERVRLETQLRHSQKMEAVGQLAAGIAHDFNNIMTIIQGHASLLLARPAPPEEVTDSLKKVLAATDRAATLTRQMLTFSRKQVIDPRMLELNRVLRNVIRMLQHVLGEHIVLQCHYAPVLPSIYGDAGMLEQVILNLAVNARDAMPNGGQLVISTSAAEIGAAQARTRPEARAGPCVCLTVTDTGCGMDADTQRRIFEPFFTTKEVGKGTGLGLAMVYGIVNQHQGWIEVESEVGRGSTFRVFFPARLQEADVPTPTFSAPPLPCGTETVLVVEDEPGLRYLVAHLLLRQGYQVLEAATGPDAVSVWHAKTRHVDLLLTDVKLPGGMSGIDLAKFLLAEKPDLKVIFTSGYSQDSHHPPFQLQEGINYLPKPYPLHRLAQLVRASLDRPVAGNDAPGQS